MFGCSGSCKMNESAVTLSEKTERMKSLRFTSAVTKVCFGKCLWCYLIGANNVNGDPS